MKKTIVLFSILVFFTQPLYGLAPRPPEWRTLEDIAVLLTVAPKIDSLAKEQTPTEERAAVQAEVERELSKIGITPLWNTLAYNNVDRSFELVIDHIDQQGRRSPYLIRFSPTTDTRYAVVQIDDEPSLNNRLARGMLGLDLSRVTQGSVSGLAGEVRLPPEAGAYRDTLLRESPDLFAYRAAVTQEAPIGEVLGAVRQVRARMGGQIKAVVLIGIGGAVLGNRAVVQTLGSREVRFVFADNIANPSRWVSELGGIKPEEILLVVSSKTGAADETMTNFWFLWEWLIRSIGPAEAAESLITKLQGVNVADTDLVTGLELNEAESGLLQIALNHIVVSATPEEKGLIYNFAVKNGIPVVPLQAPIGENFSVLFGPGQVITSLAGHDIESMRQAVEPLANAFVEDNPEKNPALEAAMYAYASGMPILAAVSSNDRLAPLFEWTRQLVNEGLGKEGKGPYLTSAVGTEASKDLMKAPKDKLFLVINVGEEKLEIPKGVSAIEINITELNAENLARIFLFLEEFTVRYATLLDVNPIGRPWVGRVEEGLARRLERVDTSPEAREQRQARLEAVKGIAVSAQVKVREPSKTLLPGLTETDLDLTTPVGVPRDESDFARFLEVGKSRQPDEMEAAAQNLAIQLYNAQRWGRTVNPFLIYSASPSARRLGEFIKYLGRRRMDRLARLGGGVLWDYLVGVTDVGPSSQYLGAGRDIALTTFIQFLQEPEPNPPVIAGARGLIQERLAGKTPKEVAALNLEELRQALNNEGRVTNTVSVPNESEENLGKLYQVLARASELYSRLVEQEDRGGETLERLVEENESTVIKPGEGVVADKGLVREVRGRYSVITLMHTIGIGEKTFVHPRVEGLASEVASGLGRFLNRISVLARTIGRIAGREGSALNRLFTATAEEFKEKAKREIYAFRLEDVIAKVEVGTEIGDLWEEITIKAANTMIARTIQEIKRVNPEAMVVVYSKDISESRIEAALNMIDSAGIFDRVVKGDSGEVLAKVVSEGWARDQKEAMGRTVFASRDTLEKLKSVVVKGEGFTPFPELAVVMQAILRDADEVTGKLPESVIEIIVSSYEVWLKLAGFSGTEIDDFLGQMRKSLSDAKGFSISLPIPPAPKPGSVIKLLDDEYEEATKTKGYA